VSVLILLMVYFLNQVLNFDKFVTEEVFTLLKGLIKLYANLVNIIREMIVSPNYEPFILTRAIYIFPAILAAIACIV